MPKVIITLEFETDAKFETDTTGQYALKECIYDYLKELIDDDSLAYEVKETNNG